MAIKKNYKEDISACKKLATAFSKKYGNIFGIDEKQIVSSVVAKKYLGRGADVFTAFSIKSNISDKLKVGETKPTRGYLWLGSDINPNGVSATQGVARTYTVHLEMKGKGRDTQRRYSDDSVYFKIYDYGTSIEQVLEKVWSKFHNLEGKVEEDGLVFSDVNYGSKFDNGGGVGVSSEIDSDNNGRGTGSDLNTDQYEKGGNTPSFNYTIGGL